MKKSIVAGCLLFAMVGAQAGWQDFFKKQLESVGGSSSTSGVAKQVLSQQDMIDGLRQALQKGVGYAVDSLGQSDGFWGNEKVRIPMPENLQKLEQLLRKLGQDKYADQFVETMNRAAEQAVPLTRDVLKESVSKMTIEDAKNILNGPQDAATSYLRKTGGEQLREKIAPMVATATEQTGVTRQYKSLFKNLGFMGKFMNPDDYDIDRYVTDKTMDGLFVMIADQEKQIRENPLARTTDLLKKVFSSQ